MLKNLKGEVKILLNNRFVEFEEITEDTLNYLRDRKQKMKETIKKTSLKTWKPAANHPWRLQNRALFNELRRLKPDIFILLESGHFYFALTNIC